MNTSYFSKRIFTAIFLLMLSPFVIGQTLSDKTLSYESLYAVIDSLENQPYLQDKYIEAYITKAKNENNAAELIQAYRTKLYEKPPVIAFQYVDSILAVALQTQDKRLLGIAHQTRSSLYYTQKDYKASLEDGLLAELNLKQTNDLYNLYKVKNNIARIKYHTASFDQALGIFLKCAQYYKEQEGVNNLMGYINSVLFINRCYYQLQDYDKAQDYIQEGIQASKKLESPNNRALWIAYFQLDEAKLEQEHQNYQQAIVLLKSALPAIQDNNDFFNTHLTYLFLGKSYWHLNNKTDALQYFERIDTLFQKQSITSIELREAYPYLITYYEDLKNLPQQLRYTTTLLQVDSLLHKDQRYITNYLHNQYDNKELLESTLLLKNKTLSNSYCFYSSHRKCDLPHSKKQTKTTSCKRKLPSGISRERK